MKRVVFLAGVCCSAVTFGQSDHNNLDKERPLRFEDAYSIAFRSFEFQNGFRLDSFSSSRPVYNFRTEIQYGFAKNKDISIGFEPSYSADTRRTLGNIAEISYFEGVAREIGNAPAFGYRIDAGIPVSGGDGVEFRLRGILTKTLGQYDKLHLNLDHIHSTKAAQGERTMTFGAILGYSHPIGYPKHFDQTFLAEIGFEQSRPSGSGNNGWIAVGIRRQLTTTGVLDLGLQSDLFVGAGVSRAPLRLTFGYSFSF
jgi:hypothetical protein